MGGIRNREAKKKANNVYSGGSGGGTKGPAIIDKRGQDLQCPYCERVFKQKERFQNHISSKHAGAAAEAAAEAATAPAEPPKNGGKGEMMKVGSKAGYYTCKSPRLILTEHCQASKRARPRVKALELPGGKWGCKAVLPGEKADQDIVVFLPDDLLAADVDDALERGALAALHRIAGHRSLERVLPAAYLPLWTRLGEVAAARRTAADARAAREKLQKEGDAKRRVREVREQLGRSGVAMATELLATVQALVAESRAALSLAGRSGGAEGIRRLAPEVADELRRLGCGDELVAEVAHSVQEGAGIDEALDWLCIHVSHAELPPKLRGHRSSSRIKVIHPSRSAAGLNAEAGNDPDVAALTRCGYSTADALAALQQSPGVGEAWALLFERLAGLAIGAGGPSRAALAAAATPAEEGTAGGDILDEERAVEEAGAQAWRDEQLVLRSMYDGCDEVAVAACTPEATALTLTVPQPFLEHFCGPGGDPPPAQGARMTVAAVRWVGARYPAAPPLIGMCCPELPRPVLLHLTRQAACHLADTAVGDPMLHELVEVASSALVASALPPLAALRRQTASLMSGPSPAWVHAPLEAHNDSAPSSAASVATARSRRHGQRPDAGGELSPAELERETRALREQVRANEEEAARRTMRETRRRLPAHACRGAVLSALQRHRVVVIAGATGCGKSTQVPQYILEHEALHGRGAAVNIVVTQPRRLAALALAERVADEHAGAPPGKTVGYAVRLKRAASRRTRLLFCTTGILLRRLAGDSTLRGVTHVVVDEVHERSLDSDLLLLLLRDTLTANPDLRIILMSATADATLFARYFNDALAGGKRVQMAPASAGSAAHDARRAAIVEIPGFTYPVRVLWLEDLVHRADLDVPTVTRGATRLNGGAYDKALAGLHSAAVAEDEQGSGGVTLPAAKRAVLEAIAAIDETSVPPYALIEAAVTHAVAAEAREGPLALLADWEGLLDAPDEGRTKLTGPGAILVFLPGSIEITRMARQLAASAPLQAALAGARAEVLPLHGALPPAEQRKVFRNFGPGVRKIVLATNVAETSVTIDDVTIVIDSGKMKEMQFDAAFGMSRLAEAWVSQAAATQRRGRAGRVRPGACIRLFSRAQWARLALQQLPEMLRSPLEPLCLTIKSVLGGRPVADVLAAALTPPDAAAVQGAVRLLRTRQLMEQESEELTALGKHLTNMPLDPAVGKALVYAAILQCTDPVLTVAAALGHGRAVFLSPPTARREADEARARLLRGSSAPAGGAPSAGERSDHIAIVVAFNTFRRVALQDGPGAARRWCGETFVSFEAMDAILGGRADYAARLCELGFVGADYVHRVRSREDVDYSDAHDVNAQDARLVHGALCAGFYPQLLRVENPVAKYTQTLAGAVESEEAAGVPKYFERAKGRVFVHPSSVMINTKKVPTGWCLYTEMVETSKVFVRQCCMLPVYALLLFGGDIKVDHVEARVTVDEWARLNAPPKVGVLVRELRQLLGQLFLRKLEDPSIELISHPVVKASIELLRYDGR